MVYPLMCRDCQLRLCNLIVFFLTVLLCTLKCYADVTNLKENSEKEIALINGKIFVEENNFSEALLIKDRIINAVGNNREILSKLTPIKSQSKVIDLNGATVIPGLIDSHIHAVRAGLTYGNEVNWIGVKDLSAALSLIKAKASTTPKKQWIIVAGGWSENQFKERRKPTLVEIEKVSLGHPVYIQHFYDSILLSLEGIRQLQKNPQVKSNSIKHSEISELFSRLTPEQNTNQTYSDWLSGTSRTISDVYNLLPTTHSYYRNKGTTNFFRELNSLGITGVMDPGGYNLPLNAYDTVKSLDLSQKLSLKIRYNICAPRRGQELNDFQTIRNALQNIKESNFFKFNGLGENVAWSMYNNENPTSKEKEQLKEVLLWAANQNLGITLHWNNNESLHHLLDVLEAVNEQQTIRPLRWSIAHISDVSNENLVRMSVLGIGWLVQNNFYYQGEIFIKKRGEAASLFIPRIQSALALGIKVSAGTDAHRVMSYNPFTSLQWLLDGQTAAGLVMGSSNERPTREQALSLYTNNSAWFSFEELTRGKLRPGYTADLAVLDKDYFSIPIDNISTIKSMMTIVDGKIVYLKPKSKLLFQH